MPELEPPASPPAVPSRAIADQVNAIGRIDAVIHNAGVYTQWSRGSTPEEA